MNAKFRKNEEGKVKKKTEPSRNPLIRSPVQEPSPADGVASEPENVRYLRVVTTDDDDPDPAA